MIYKWMHGVKLCLCKMSMASGVIMYLHMYLIEKMEKFIPQKIWFVQVAFTLAICMLIYSIFNNNGLLKTVFITGVKLSRQEEKK